jgi:cation diffusion facilitator CzcD-associated flavoprotein CzcO
MTVDIIGTGLYELSIAAYFRAAGSPCRLFGQPVHGWAGFMPEGMVLRSEPFACSLWDPGREYTYGRFCAAHGIDYRPIGLPPTRERFLDYAAWFRQQAVGDVDTDMVRAIRRGAHGFALELASGAELTTGHVILATGFMAFRHVPELLAAVPAPLAVHSSCIDALASYAGRDVTIVGAGQSALESAALLHEAGATVRVIARTRQLKWNLGPKPSRTLLDRVISPYAGVGAGWKELAVSELPQVFRVMYPAEKRHRFVATSFGPASSAKAPIME